MNDKKKRFALDIRRRKNIAKKHSINELLNLKREINRSWILLIVAAASLATTTVAWFANSKKLESEMAVKVREPIKAESSYTAYVYDIYAETGDEVTTTDFSSLSMQAYDLIFKSRNRYTPVVVRISVAGDDVPKAGGILTLKLNRDTTKSNAVSSSFYQLSSNLLRYTLVANGDYYSPDARTLYTRVDNGIYDQVLHYTGQVRSGDNIISDVFTTVSGTKSNYTYTKVESLELSVSYDSEALEGDTLNLYLYITYDEILTENYRQESFTNIDRNLLTNGNVETFENDLVDVEIINISALT